MDDMELSIEPLALDAVPEAAPDAPVIEEVAAAAPIAAAAATADSPAARSTAKAEESVRVPAGRLDALMDRVGELVIAQSR
ncbi:hypothetical protein ABTC66_20520, partial [Acinetobacter baumannii]